MNGRGAVSALSTDEVESDEALASNENAEGAESETSETDEELQIPTQPKAPSLGPQHLPTTLPHCERNVVVNNKVMEIDSNLGNDAGHLRTLVADVPEALAEVEKYQDNKRMIRNLAYLGSAGLALMAVGFLFVGSQNRLILTGKTLGELGLGITVGSFLFGFGKLYLNESHLTNAIQYYNDAHPDSPIQMEFHTRFEF